MGDSMLFSRCAAVSAVILALSASFASLLFTGGALATPPFPAEDRTIPYSGNLPTCEDDGTLQQITQAFNYSRYWYSRERLELDHFEAIKEIGFRTNGPEFIPRRYCVARATFSDGRQREVKYNLIERGGFVGIGSGVEWCVVGEDPFHVYSPACRAAGP
jgi:hypothetical protein